MLVWEQTGWLCPHFSYLTCTPCHSSTLDATLRHLLFASYFPLGLRVPPSRFYSQMVQCSCQGVLAAIARDRLDIHYTLHSYTSQALDLFLHCKRAFKCGFFYGFGSILDHTHALSFHFDGSFILPPFRVSFFITLALIFVAFLLHFAAVRLSGAIFKVLARDMGKEARYLVRCASRAGSQDWSVLPSVFDSSFAFNIVTDLLLSFAWREIH